MFFTIITLVNTTCLDEVLLSNEVWMLDNQISYIGSACALSMMKIGEKAQNNKQHHNSICEPFEKTFKEMRKKAEKSKNDYAAYLHGVLSKDENICNFLGSQEFANQLNIKVEEYCDYLKAQKDDLFYNLMYYFYIDTVEYKEIKEKYERVEQQVIKFIRLLVANYEQLRSDILYNMKEDE